MFSYLPGRLVFWSQYWTKWDFASPFNAFSGTVAELQGRSEVEGFLFPWIGSGLPRNL
jgi:hypothetical protein